jgi:hypothetical protein
MTEREAFEAFWSQFLVDLKESPGRDLPEDELLAMQLVARLAWRESAKHPR